MKHREMSSSSEDEPSSPVVSGGGGGDHVHDLRRGPWTVEEDHLLVNYIAAHGEGRWNALARCAGLKRTGKSCRLRWLNYLRPDLRRGNMTAQEQVLILELHSRWGNRWSKIAQQLPGRTDNEIKNYWRTRVQKHARQLNCDVNSQQFKDLVRYLWMPRLLERIHSPGEQQLPAPAWSAADVLAPAPVANNNNDVDQLSSSCTTAASSASSVSTDGMQQQQPLLVVSTPPVVANAAWSSSCTDNNNNNNNNITSVCDTWCQPPHTTTATQQFGGSWSEVPGAGLSAGVGVDMALPDIAGDTMWGADDLWYTHILMGL